jgi:hypothetical protein
VSCAPSSRQPAGNAESNTRWSWTPSLLLYAIFAAIVFIVQGSQPRLGPDHVSYFQLADSIMAARPGGDYWRETNSVRSFGVLLAYLHGWTGSHVLSMKMVLAVATVLYLLSAELLFGLFTGVRWHAVLFAILSGFAVSFGISSWGVTDSTALLPRTWVAPVILVSIWFWLRFHDRPVKYLAFSFLVIGSLLHLSTFYVAGILGLLELWDFIAIRRCRIDRRVPAFLGGLALAAGLLFVFEFLGVSIRIFHGMIPKFFSATHFAIQGSQPAAPGGAAMMGSAVAPASGLMVEQSVAASAKEAWALELSLRPWRNMPLGMANVANMLSSSALVLLLAVYGLVRAHAAGLRPADRFMGAMLVAVPVFAFLPQTALWVLRSFTGIYPATIEEVRAIGFIMIPALYFVLRLFELMLEEGGRHRRLKAAAVVIATLALPLAMKSLPYGAREGILSVMTDLRLVDPSNPPSVINARSALGITHSTPFYYSTEGVIRWIRDNTPPDARILTDRDELILLRGREIVGPRQVAAVPERTGIELPEKTQMVFRTMEAMQSRDTANVERLARSYGADFFVVPWPVDHALYRDHHFSVVRVGRGRSD